MFQTAVGFFADHARHDFARLDRHWLIDHALLLRVVAHFDIARHREVLAERMTDETVVGQNAAQVGVAFEHDAEQVERFALVPVRRRPDSTTDGTIGTSSSGANTRTRRRQLCRRSTARWSTRRRNAGLRRRRSP